MNLEGTEFPSKGLSKEAGGNLMVAAVREQPERCNPVTIAHADVEWSGKLRAGWVVERSALECAIVASGIRLNEVEVGRISILGDGMYRSGYQVYISGHPSWQRVGPRTAGPQCRISPLDQGDHSPTPRLRRTSRSAVQINQAIFLNIPRPR